jgi:hypothetical protein
MQPLNSPIELGIRTLVILTAVFPLELDLGRLVLLDHCLLHSADMGGPPSIHPALPARSGELGFKRTNIERGLQVMIRAGLVEAISDAQGIAYRASEEASPFLRLLSSNHVVSLTARAQWLSDRFAALTEQELRNQMSHSLGRWTQEFDEPIVRTRRNRGPLT